MSSLQTARPAGGHRWPTAALIGLLLLRLAIGWHFLYEGLAKLFDPGWSAAAYLRSSEWLLADLFHWMADNPAVLHWVNLLNVWGLILIGAGLMLGVFTRAASLAGALLLGLYYLAHPPLVGVAPAIAEGSYLIVNKNLVEMFALVLLAVVPKSNFAGLGRYIAAIWRGLSALVRRSGEAPLHHDPEGLSRREILATAATLPLLGGFVWAVLKKRAHKSAEERILAAGSALGEVDAVTSPTVKIAEALSLDDLKAKVPQAKLGHLDVSRIVLGGNLMNGYAHARDLIYVSPLVKAYHTVEKVLETLWIAEQCGMNTLVLNTHVGGQFIEEYRRRKVGGTQFLAQCRTNGLMDLVRAAIDLGVKGAYIQSVEGLVDKDKFDEVAEALEFMRKNGLVAGVGSHNIAAVKKCVDHGIVPDFCMKTFHHYDYWSARPDDEYKDNRYCDDRLETVEFMKSFDKPWIAFKVLAAGSIHPKDGFRFAFENGADFICVGMYDFQVVQDANIVCDVLQASLKRERPWRALT